VVAFVWGLLLVACSSGAILHGSFLVRVGGVGKWTFSKEVEPLRFWLPVIGLLIIGLVVVYIAVRRFSKIRNAARN